MRPFGHVISGRHANLVEDVVVEVVLVGADARLLVRVHRERGREVLAAVLLRDERIDVGRVRRIVQGDERRIHVAGRSRGRRKQQESRRSGQLQHTSEFLHLNDLMPGVVGRFPSGAPRARRAAA